MSWPWCGGFIEDLGAQCLKIIFSGLFLCTWGLWLATVEDRMISKNKKVFETFVFFSVTKGETNVWVSTVAKWHRTPSHLIFSSNREVSTGPI